MKKKLSVLVYKIKLKFKLNFGIILASFIQLIAILFFGWLHNKLIEMATIYVCFFVFRTSFEKQFHAKTVWMCTLYTLIIFYIISFISPDIKTSIILIVCFTYSINLISYYVKDYLDLKDRFKAKKASITRGMSEEKLREICNTNNLNELEYKILKYFYCDRLSLTAISYKVDYSYDYVAELKGKILKKINN